MLSIGSVLDTRTELVKDASARLGVCSVVEIISGMLVFTIVTVVDVSCRRVLSNSLTVCVLVFVELDVFVEAET